MKKISAGEMKRATVVEYKELPKSPFVVVLDNIRSRHNTGSVFRTSDAFRVEKIFLCGITATPPCREIQKTALGSTESVEWAYSENTTTLIKELKLSGYKIISVEQVDRGIFLKDFFPKKNSKYALVFGNEIKGVSQEILDLSDFCVEIPQFGTKHSFNISVTAGIVLYDIYNKIFK